LICPARAVLSRSRSCPLYGVSDRSRARCDPGSPPGGRRKRILSPAQRTDQSLTALICQRGSQSTSSGAHGPLLLWQGSCPCRPCGKSASPSGGDRQGQTFPHSWHSDFPAWSWGSIFDSGVNRATPCDRDGDEFCPPDSTKSGSCACPATWHRVQAGR